MTTEVRDEWLTPTECARSLKISRNTVYSLIAAGALPGPMRVGHQWRISRRALDAAAAMCKGDNLELAGPRTGQPSPWPLGLPVPVAQ